MASTKAGLEIAWWDQEVAQIGGKTHSHYARVKEDKDKL